MNTTDIHIFFSLNKCFVNVFTTKWNNTTKLLNSTLFKNLRRRGLGWRYLGKLFASLMFYASLFLTGNCSSYAQCLHTETPTRQNISDCFEQFHNLSWLGIKKEHPWRKVWSIQQLTTDTNLEFALISSVIIPNDTLGLKVIKFNMKSWNFYANKFHTFVKQNTASFGL